MVQGMSRSVTKRGLNDVLDASRAWILADPSLVTGLMCTSYTFFALWYEAEEQDRYERGSRDVRTCIELNRTVLSKRRLDTPPAPLRIIYSLMRKTAMVDQLCCTCLEHVGRDGDTYDDTAMYVDF